MDQYDAITLTGITGHGHHGVFESERFAGQEFRVDVTVYVDAHAGASGDDLSQTVHYGELAEQVHDLITGPAVDLIETLAEKIAAVTLSFPAARAVDVTVHKPQAPIEVPFENVSVKIHRAASRSSSANVPALEPESSSAAELPAESAESAEPLAVPTESAELPAGSAPPVAPPVMAAAPAGPPAVPAAPPPPPELTEAAAAVALESETEVPSEIASAPAGEEALDVFDQRPEHPTSAILALGANLGPAQETLAAAIADIAAIAEIELVDVSPLARTAPVGPQQPDFYNCVVRILTTLTPRELLQAGHEIEDAHERERTEHWGPRTLDIDVIKYGDVVGVSADLELPHPRAHERAFVLAPWAELEPNGVLPGLGGGPIATLAASAPDRDGIRWMALDWLR